MSTLNKNNSNDNDSTELDQYVNDSNRNIISKTANEDNVLNNNNGTTVETKNNGLNDSKNVKSAILIVDISKQQSNKSNDISIVRIYIEKYISSTLVGIFVIYILIGSLSSIREQGLLGLILSMKNNNDTILSLPLVIISTLITISTVQTLPAIINIINNLSLKQHILLCAIASIKALFILLCSLFTYTTIFSFIGFISLSCVGIYLAINDIKKYGLASYVPDWILDYEYPQTIDEYMRDTTFMNEHRYLFLYFIPGIDLEYAISQLPQRRRDNLFRKWTIADMLGLDNTHHHHHIDCNNVIEEIEGNEQEKEEMLLTNGQEGNVIQYSNTNIANDLEWDHEEDEVMNNNTIIKKVTSEEEEVPSEVLTYDNTVASTRSNNNLDDDEENKIIDSREEEWKYEENLVNNALSSFYTNTSTTIIKSMTSVLQSYESIYRMNAIIGNFFIIGMFGSLTIFLPKKNGMTYSGAARNMSFVGMFASGTSLCVRLGFKGLVSYMENYQGDGDSHMNRFSSLD